MILWRLYSCTASSESFLVYIACVRERERAGSIRMRLHLCTVSSVHSLVTYMYAPYCVYVSRDDSAETVLVHSLL